MADNFLDSDYQLRPPFATPGPVDQYAPLPPNQFAGQGIHGAPVDQPFFPGGQPDYPSGPSGGAPNLPFEAPPQGPTSEGFAPRGPNESASQYFARKQAAGVPFTAADFMAVDAEHQAMQAYLAAGAGGASSTTTTTSKQNDSPELRELRTVRSRAVKDMGDRLAQTAGMAEETGLAQSQLYAQRVDALKAETAAEQAKQEEQKSEMLRRQTEVDKASKDYVKAGQEIDPNRFMSGGRGVLAALAMAAGAYGATLGKTQNFAQQIIDNAIDRDLSAQKMALNVKRDALTQAQQAFQNYRAIFQDDAAARAAVRADAREVFAAQLGTLASKMHGQEQKANILTQRDQLLLQNNQLRIEQAELLAGRVQRSTTTQSGGVPAGMGIGDPMERMAKYAANAKAFNELNAADGPGTSDKALYNEVAGTIPDYASMIKLGAQVQDLLKKTDGPLGGAVERGTGLTKDSKVLDSARGQLRLAIINASSGKAFTDAERVEIMDMLNKGAWTNEGLGQKLEQVQSYMAGKIQARIGTLHPNLRNTLRQRMHAGGVDNAVLDSMFTGTAAKSREQQAVADGARSY